MTKEQKSPDIEKKAADLINNVCNQQKESDLEHDFLFLALRDAIAKALTTKELSEDELEKMAEDWVSVNRCMNCREQALNAYEAGFRACERIGKRE